jgi:hypothetical protein
MLSGRWLLAVLRIPLGLVISALIGGMALQVRATPNPQILDSNITLADVTAAQKNCCPGVALVSWTDR